MLLSSKELFLQCFQKMIIKIEQTNANFKNKFEVKVNNGLKYLAGTPWMNMNLPLDIENTRRCIMTTIDENICYTTSYNIIENISNTVIPMKWMFTGEQKSNIFNIYDDKNYVFLILLSKVLSSFLLVLHLLFL